MDNVDINGELAKTDSYSNEQSNNTHDNVNLNEQSNNTPPGNVNLNEQSNNTPPGNVNLNEQSNNTPVGNVNLNEQSNINPGNANQNEITNGNVIENKHVNKNDKDNLNLNQEGSDQSEKPEDTSVEETSNQADGQSESCKHDAAFPLLAATAEFNSQKVEELLTNGHNPNERDESGHNSLHVLIQNYVKLDLVEQITNKPSALEILSLLVQNKFDINSTNNSKQTALHLSARYNHYPEIIKALLAAGAKVNMLDKNGHTPLHIAITKKNYDTAKTLVEGGADVNATNKEGKAPLHVLAKGKQTLPMLELLLNCGANVHAKDLGGRTALHIASRWGQEDNIEELLRSEASVNMVDNSGMTSLHYAVTGDITGKSTLLLLNNKAHLNIQDHISRETALHRAIRTRSVDNVKEIMKFRPSLNIQDIVGDTPVHTAAGCYDICVWQLLIRKGVDLTVVNRDGYTPLQKAEKYKNKVALDLVSMVEYTQAQ